MQRVDKNKKNSANNGQKNVNPHMFCRDSIIQPMGVDSEGKLVPMSGLRENSLTEERESGSENDGEAENDGEKN